MLVEATTWRFTAPILVGSNSSSIMHQMVHSLISKTREHLMLQEEETKKETMFKFGSLMAQRLKNGKSSTLRMQKPFSQRVLIRTLDLKLRDHSILFLRCG
jgi:hypothetical protein